MHTDEWLRQAKALPVGMSKRVYHGAERRTNLVVKNHPAYWSAYCQHCKTGGRVNKEYVSAAPVVVSVLSKDPGALRPLTLYTPDPAIPYDKVGVFLHKKHMCLDYFVHLNPHWAAKDNRIVFITPQQMVGRDITEKSPAKWHKYSGYCSYIPAKNSPLAGQNIILTEDLLSATKAQFFAPDGWLVVAMMGTTMYADLLAQLIQAKHIIVMLDGDEAGQDGTVNVVRKLKLLGLSCSSYKLAATDDPKDMTGQWWLDFYKGIAI